MIRKSDKKAVQVKGYGPKISEVVRYTHNEIVRHCDYCGKPMSRSDVNDYGELCERCYMREYYGDEL